MISVLLRKSAEKLHLFTIRRRRGDDDNNNDKLVLPAQSKTLPAIVISNSRNAYWSYSVRPSRAF